MVTIKDVAKLAGVAVSTASYALNHSSKVSPNTARKVIEAAKQLNYQKNGLARDLKRNKTETIGLILSDLSGPFYSDLIRGVQDTTLSNGYGLVACSSLGGSSSTSIKYIRERRVDGVIILASNIEDSIIVEAAREDFPIVVLDRTLDSEFVMNISVDNVNGAYLAVSHLIQLGHTRIGYLGGPFTSRDNRFRMDGFLKALEEHQLLYEQRWTIEGRFTRDGGFHAAKLLLMQGELPTALFCANDEMAIGAIQAFQEAGVDIPREISIVGFDDIELAPYIQPALTTIKQAKYEMGSFAAHLIHQALHHEIPKKKEYMFPTVLIERNSTAQPER